MMKMELKTIFDVLKNFLNEDGVLRTFPAKFKMKIYALYYLASKFESQRMYSEREVNELLNQWCGFGDPATLRRELYNKRFLNRKNDCSAYWAEDKTPELSDFGLE
jgi:hypothetical protein